MVDTTVKFGVPTGGGGGRGGLIDLKKNYRWRVRVINFGPIAGGLELTQYVESVNKPSIEHEKVQVDAYNSRAWYAGKHTWQPITMVVKDDQSNLVTRLVQHQMQKQLNHFEQTGFAAGINYKFYMLIESLDGGNDVVQETWNLEGCFLESIQFAELNYAESGYQKITMTLQYDNATTSDGLMTQLPEIIPGIRL